MAFVEFIPGRYFVGLWCVALPAETFRGTVDDGGRRVRYAGADWLFCLWREADQPATWNLDYRIRYHVDRKTWGSADVKHGGHPRGLAGSEMEMTRKMEQVIGIIAAENGGEGLFWPIYGDNERAGELLESNPPPFLHLGEEPIHA